ncbi:uncharacterized protein PFL1_01187 [Pseudozyma flocculosa PF-1]|uniref:D-lactate dehydratase n=1 Tax=Pseudozyma flocculosa TaxID=84751 RepID=A0A5C3EWQ6_9BASI|nr:uncharacterized protein PFL1_01187 [Pseudozyma flocculosa PF-1]EPQ30998.1 hypothetical protein PFL1_01187 [Pseudozyma flocculosa PF-1]SPO35837.1 related to Protein DJ-1 [Pseudozyma flocculosa]
MPSALILIAQGTEEMEYTITYDILVRGGVKVQSALVGSSQTSPTDPHGAKYVECTRGVKIVPDLRLPDLEGGKALDYDAIIVPGGGPGANTIANNSDVQQLINAMYGRGKIVACICAGSLAALKAKIGTDNDITSHPSVKDQLVKDYTYREDRVVIADNLITSRGPGTAFAFALAIVEALQGKEKRDEIEGPMILPDKL